MITADGLAMFARDLGTDVKAFVADYVAKSIGDIRGRLEAVERKAADLAERPIVPGPPGPPGKDGEPGRDGINGKDGRDGIDGKNGEPGPKGLDGVGTIGPQGEPGVAGKDGRDGEPGPRGADGAPGRDADPAMVHKAVADAVTAALGDLSARIGLEVKSAVAMLPAAPAGRDGMPGRDGASVTIADLIPVIRGEVAGAVDAAVKALPTPTPAEPDREAILATVLPEITKALAALPQPRDGRDGLPGVPGPPGDKGERGADGTNGRDGLDGKDGADGLHGKDGMGFDDLSLVFDESTGYVLRVTNGERVKEWPVPVMWDAGVWRFGRRYPQGAAVTSKGQLWIAQKGTTGRPGEGPDWRLAVRRGEDGKPPKPE